MNYFYFSPYSEADKNMALDEYFIERLGDEDMLLMFYINTGAVIVGKNQNAWKECDVARMRQDGVILARRISGGGAVFHDGGNLNFSFIGGKNRYDLERQKGLILKTLNKLGIPAEYTGRNDMTVGGKKFSGNAFCKRKSAELHHGTLLVSSDLSRLKDYLTVSPAKILSKGIESVRSRVCNLTEFMPDLTVRRLADMLTRVYEAEYGAFSKAAPAEAELQPLFLKHASWDWRLGAAPRFDAQIENRFSFGGVELYLTLKSGRITDLNVYTDALDTELSEKLASALKGARFSPEELAGSVRQAGLGEAGEEIARFIETAEF